MPEDRSQSLCEWRNIVHCQRCQLSGYYGWKGASVAGKFNLFDRNVQNKHKISERNSVIGFFNLRMKHSRGYNKFGYLSETQYGHEVIGMRRVSDGGYLQ